MDAEPRQERRWEHYDRNSGFPPKRRQTTDFEKGKHGQGAPVEATVLEMSLLWEETLVGERHVGLRAQEFFGYKGGMFRPKKERGVARIGVNRGERSGEWVRGEGHLYLRPETTKDWASGG